jgi:hypothetical protein
MSAAKSNVHTAIVCDACIYFFLVCISLPPLSLLLMLLLPCLPTVIMMFPFRVPHTVQLWFCVMAMPRVLSCAPVFLAFPPPPPLLLFALNLPFRLVAAADALSGMVHSDLHLLLVTLSRILRMSVGADHSTATHS